MDKKKFVLRISKEMYEQIEKWSADEFRSANGQIEWIIQDSLKRHGRIKSTRKDQPSSGMFNQDPGRDKPS